MDIEQDGSIRLDQATQHPYSWSIQTILMSCQICRKTQHSSFALWWNMHSPLILEQYFSS